MTQLEFQQEFSLTIPDGVVCVMVCLAFIIWHHPEVIKAALNYRKHKTSLHVSLYSSHFCNKCQRLLIEYRVNFKIANITFSVIFIPLGLFTYFLIACLSILSFHSFFPQVVLLSVPCIRPPVASVLQVVKFGNLSHLCERAPALIYSLRSASSNKSFRCC